MRGVVGDASAVVNVELATFVNVNEKWINIPSALVFYALLFSVELRDAGFSGISFLFPFFMSKSVMN